MDILKSLKHTFSLIIAGFACSMIVQNLALATDSNDTVIVNVDNFARAETATQIDRALKLFLGGKVNTWGHLRDPTPLLLLNYLAWMATQQQ